MGSAAEFGEPTMTNKYPPLDDEEAGEGEVVILEREKTSSFRLKTQSGSTDNSTITITNSSASSSSNEDVCTEVPIRKELSFGQNGHGGQLAFESLEASEISQQETDHGFRGEHDDGKIGSVYFDRETGFELDGVTGTKPDAAETHTDENLNGERNWLDTQNGSSAEDNDRVPEIEEIKKIGSSEEPNAVVIEEEVDTEVVEDYDVEKVLEKQETHDLYCPNCNSCITKRVVLKRRKRKIRHVLGDSKHEKLDIPISVAPEIDHTVGISSADSARLAGGDRETDKGPCLFRCLSCFSIFFPSGEGFKLFHSSKDVKEDIETPLISQEPAKVKTNWFFSLFGSDKKETAVEQGGAANVDSQVNPVDNLQSSPENRVFIQNSDSNISIQVGEKVDTESPNTDRSVINKVEMVEDGLKTLVSSSVEKSQPQINRDVDVTNAKAPPKKVRLSPIKDSLLEKPTLSVMTKIDSAVTHATDGKLDIVVDPVNVVPKSSQGALFDDTPTESDSLLQTRTETQTPETRVVEAGEGRKVEFLKSIVYGGLLESITSLGVVSSGAASGASTLNILVLGLANLIGGLILIVHNLQELKEEIPRRTAVNGNQRSEQEEGRYKQLLGRRENFRLHATVAILSFLIFGLIPPVVYGFSFHKTGNRDYKAAAVLPSSLVCVVLLAIGKAHVKRPRGSYFKTVFYYATIAISASTISYVVGGVVGSLLEKYGWSDGSTGPEKIMLPLMGRKAGFGYSRF